MRIPLPQNDLSADVSLQPAQVEELLRFVRSLDAYCEPDQLLRSLPPMLSELVVSNTTALVVVNSGILSGYVAAHESTIATESALEPWRPEIQQIMSQEPHPVVVSPLDSETEFRGMGPSSVNTETSLSVCSLLTRRFAVWEFSASPEKARIPSRGVKSIS